MPQTLPWSRSERRKWDLILAKLTDQIRQPLMSTPVPDKADATDYLVLQHATDDMVHLSLAFFHGFDNAHTSEAADLAAWAKTVNRRRTSWIIAGTMAAASCAALEGFLTSVGERWVDSATVTRVKSGPRGASLGALSELDARQKIVGWTRPSGRGGGATWIRRLEDIYACSIDQSVAETLSSMVTVRNRWIHEPRPTRECDIEPPYGGETGVWTPAVQLLARVLIANHK